MFPSLPNRLFLGEGWGWCELCVLIISLWFTDGSGGWNSSGCRVLNSSAEETRCACNHLTSFGILLVSYSTKNLQHLTHPCLKLYSDSLGCYYNWVLPDRTFPRLDRLDRMLKSWHTLHTSAVASQSFSCLSPCSHIWPLGMDPSDQWRLTIYLCFKLICLST